MGLKVFSTLRSHLLGVPHILVKDQGLAAIPRESQLQGDGCEDGLIKQITLIALMGTMSVSPGMSPSPSFPPGAEHCPQGLSPSLEIRGK